MAEQSLVDRVVDRNTENISEEIEDTEKIVSEIRVSGENVEFKSLNSDWSNLVTVQLLAEQSVDEVLRGRDLVISESISDKLEEFKTVCSACWDDEAQMFRVDYETDSEGDLKRLIVPLESSISDDFIVQKIHNDDGKFVAEGIENQIDCEMYELWNRDMYVESVEGSADVLVSEDPKGFYELFSESVREQTHNEFDEDEYLYQETGFDWILKTLVSMSLIGGVFAAIYLTFVFFGFLGMVGLFFISYFGIIPSLVILFFVGEIGIGVMGLNYAFSEYRKTEYNLFFETGK